METNGQGTTLARSAEVTEIIKGLMEVQPALHVVKNKTATIPGKDGRSGHSYGYADLASVWDACRDLLKAQGMMVNHTSDTNDSEGNVVVTATLWHTTGQWMSASIKVKPAMMTPQGVGSALTYARRYTLSMLVGIVVDDDDDGKAGSRATAARSTPAPDTLEAKRAQIIKLLKEYKGTDKKEIAGLCRAYEDAGGWTTKYADDIIARLKA